MSRVIPTLSGVPVCNWVPTIPSHKFATGLGPYPNTPRLFFGMTTRMSCSLSAGIKVAATRTAVYLYLKDKQEPYYAY